MYRRSFLKSLAALPFISLTSTPGLKTKAVAKIAINFNNGDKLEILIGEIPGEPGQYTCISNNMNHHESIITVSYDLEEVFTRGELYDISKNQKPIVEYRGYNRFGDLVYEGEADNKTWVTL